MDLPVEPKQEQDPMLVQEGIDAQSGGKRGRRGAGSRLAPPVNLADKGVSVERWIFKDGLRIGQVASLSDYIAMLPDRVLSAMSRDELELFYRTIMDLGGFYRVQTMKRWQQVVKACRFAQTTSSSYSTRNKYESYLLPYELHNLLTAAVGRGALRENGVTDALITLGHICAYHFEAYDANCAKKNLVDPIQEMLMNDREAIDTLVSYVDFTTAPGVGTGRSKDFGLAALRVLRSLFMPPFETVLLEAFWRRNHSIRSMVSLFSTVKDSRGADALVIANLLAACASLAPEDSDILPAMLDVFNWICRTDLNNTRLGRQLLSRLRRVPPYVLAGINAMAIAAVIPEHSTNGRQELVRSCLRLCTLVFLAQADRASPHFPDEDPDAVVSGLTKLVNDGTESYSLAAKTCVNALLRWRPELSAQFTNTVGETFNRAGDWPENVDNGDSSSEDRASKAEGRRRATPVAPLSLLGRKRGRSPSPTTVVRALMGSESDEDSVQDPNENSEEREKRKKRERERKRRIRLKILQEERARLAADRRERNAVVAPRRPRRPPSLTAEAPAVSAADLEDSVETKLAMKFGPYIATFGNAANAIAKQQRQKQLEKRGEDGGEGKIRKGRGGKRERREDGGEPGEGDDEDNDNNNEGGEDGGDGNDNYNNNNNGNNGDNNNNNNGPGDSDGGEFMELKAEKLARPPNMSAFGDNRWGGGGGRGGRRRRVAPPSSAMDFAAANASAASAKQEAEEEARNEKYKYQLQLLSLEGQLLDRDVAIANLAGTIRILEGNLRFISGLLPSYSDAELTAVQENAMKILDRTKALKEAAATTEVAPSLNELGVASGELAFASFVKNNLGSANAPASSNSNAVVASSNTNTNTNNNANIPNNNNNNNNNNSVGGGSANFAAASDTGRAPLHRCVVCKKNPVSQFAAPCMCFAYCKECLAGRAGNACAVCGLNCMKICDGK